MTKDKILEAIDQMKVQCELKMPTYEGMSARECLAELGYDRDQQDAVLTYIFHAGFNYCLDPMFPSKERGKDVPTPYFACVWGPDQLESRLAFIR